MLTPRMSALKEIKGHLAKNYLCKCPECGTEITEEDVNKDEQPMVSESEDMEEKPIEEGMEEEPTESRRVTSINEIARNEDEGLTRDKKEIVRKLNRRA